MEPMPSSTDQVMPVGADPGFHVRSGGERNILKHKVYSCERRRREAMLGGPACSLVKYFEKNCAIWCILGPIKDYITLLFLRLIF